MARPSKVHVVSVYSNFIESASCRRVLIIMQISLLFLWVKYSARVNRFIGILWGQGQGDTQLLFGWGCSARTAEMGV